MFKSICDSLSSEWRTNQSLPSAHSDSKKGNAMLSVHFISWSVYVLHFGVQACAQNNSWVQKAPVILMVPPPPPTNPHILSAVKTGSTSLRPSRSDSFTEYFIFPFLFFSFPRLKPFNLFCNGL